MNRITATYNIDGITITVKYNSERDRLAVEERIIYVLEGDPLFGELPNWEQDEEE